MLAEVSCITLSRQLGLSAYYSGLYIPGLDAIKTLLKRYQEIARRNNITIVSYRNIEVNEISANNLEKNLYKVLKMLEKS